MLVTCVPPTSSSKCQLSMRHSVNRKIHSKQYTPRHRLEVVLQMIVSMEGVILTNTWIYAKQCSEKLSELPKVCSCTVVEPGLLTPNLVFFLLLHDVSVNY